VDVEFFCDTRRDEGFLIVFGLEELRCWRVDLHAQGFQCDICHLDAEDVQLFVLETAEFHLQWLDEKSGVVCPAAKFD
jgi:hypothetical protein